MTADSGRAMADHMAASPDATARPSMRRRDLRRNREPGGRGDVLVTAVLVAAAAGVLVLSPSRDRVWITAGLALPALVACVMLLRTRRDNDALRATVAATRDQADHQDRHDGLTGLARRPVFTERVREALDRQDRSGSAIAILLCDLDAFTTVNEALGHPVGDTLLTQVARRLESSLPPDSTLARLGGDEFAVLIERLRPDQACLVATGLADTLKGVIGEPFAVGEREVSMSIAIGVAVVDAEGTRPGPSEVLSRADTALYTAKRAHLRRPVVFSEGLSLPEEHDWLVRPAVEQALREGRILAHYQPIVELAGGRVHAVEALARWDRAHDLVGPEAFLPVLTRAGILPDLTEYMIRHTATQLARWHRTGVDGGLRVSVNIPPPLLGDPRFGDRVLAALDAAQLPPSGLVVEITEEWLLDDVDAAARAVARLRRRGVQIWLDDFGAGYSSVGLLHRLPLDAVKFDKCLIESLPTDPWLRRLVGGLISLGEDLGLDVIAEGISRPEQLDVLHELGCRLGQGYLLASPAPAGLIRPRLERGRVGEEACLAPDGPMPDNVVRLTDARRPTVVPPRHAVTRLPVHGSRPITQ